MRALVIAVFLAAGCGGKRQVQTPTPEVVTAFPAARWVPGHPTYVFAARTMRDAQRAVRDAIDTFGFAFGADPNEISAALERVLAIDPLRAEAVASIGIDLDGGVAVFSEDVHPTFVARLASPPALHAFVDAQRQRGLVTQSVVIEGSEVLSAKLDDETELSWVVDGEWLWVHVGAVGEGTGWFTASKRPGPASWVGKWQAAEALAQKSAGLVGIVELAELAAKLATRVPEAAPCARQLEAVRGVGIAVEGEGNFVGGKIAVDLGPAAQPLATHLLAPPPGWETASARAPLAVQWNLDFRVAAGWLEPCIAQVDGRGRANGAAPDLTATFDQLGMRTARVFLHSLDVDNKSGAGVVSADLSHSRYFARLLDEIPMRSKFEKSRTFGAYQGKHLSVPFVAKVDYVLDDRVFLVAMGDGLLERAASGTPAGPPAVLAVDVIPSGFPVGVWEWLFAQAELPAPRRLAQRLAAWEEIHLGAHLDRDRLVIEARGNRR